MKTTEWQRRCKLKDAATAPTGTGVYRIRVKNDGKWMELPRLFGVDRKGVVYIGSAEGKGGLRKRLSTLRRALLTEDSSAKHVAGRRFRAHAKLMKFFADAKWYCEYREAPAVEVHDIEHRELDDYRQRYGDNPPLNRSDGLRPVDK